MISPIVFLVLAAGSVSPARAERFTLGASVGSSQSGGGTSSVDQMTTRGVFGRLRLFGNLSIEGELGSVELAESTGAVRPAIIDDTGFDAIRARRGSATLRYDLASRGTLYPHLLAGVGVENWRSRYVDWAYGKREVGIGLDVRITGGLRLGVDVRAGTRELIGTRQSADLVIDLYIPPPLPEQPTSYVATRLTLGAAF